jgi:hypothetical protein
MSTRLSNPLNIEYVPNMSDSPYGTSAELNQNIRSESHSPREWVEIVAKETYIEFDRLTATGDCDNRPADSEAHKDASKEHKQFFRHNPIDLVLTDANARVDLRDSRLAVRAMVEPVGRLSLITP